MRTEFHSYIPKTGKQLEALWADARIVLDTSLLLNLYRYSQKTRDAYLQVLNRYKQRLWIPYQVGLEFNRNRPEVISQQARKYDDARKTAQDLISVLDNDRQHPFIDPRLEDATKRILSDLISHLDHNLGDYERLYTEDPVLDRICDLLDGRVGSRPDEQSHQQLSSLAETRIADRVPPGYCDAGKDQSRSTGDAILWMQLLDFVQEHNCNVIFVTDDQKEDWWLEARGKTIGPRPELGEEFSLRANTQFHAYKPDKFLLHAQKTLGLDSDKSMISEISSVSSRRQQNRRNGLQLSSLPPGMHARRVCEHIAIHQSELDDFVRLMSAVPSEQWVEAKSTLELPETLVGDTSSIMDSCRCIARICEDVQEYRNRSDASTLDLDDIRPTNASRTFRTLASLPPQAFDLVRTLSQPQSGEQ